MARTHSLRRGSASAPAAQTSAPARPVSSGSMPAPTPRPPRPPPSFDSTSGAGQCHNSPWSVSFPGPRARDIPGGHFSHAVRRRPTYSSHHPRPPMLPLATATSVPSGDRRMSQLDWAVLAAALAAMVGYGIWKGGRSRDTQGYLLAGREMRWGTVALSIMATQASAITFLSTPGQAYADGMRFVQFYFGLPIAMIVLSATAVPLYHRLKVYTAYEYLEGRFDLKTRALTAFLFLIQRGLAAGLTIFAPSLILSVILGWDVRVTVLVIGALVVVYTTSGGARAVSRTQTLQAALILAGMAAAFVVLLASLPAGVSFLDALRVAGKAGRLRAIDPSFSLTDRYTLWSGLIGGAFLALSYFGTDPSQVQRYLAGRSVAASRLGLLFNGMAKVPMQFGILFIGASLFAFYQFEAPPVFFNPADLASR